ncbi:MAG: SCO family protein [Gemmatimonadetes bacterium]|jgi:protein SCO1|nr:SCO family protein [Gemmatimonadota bacterium]
MARKTFLLLGSLILWLSSLWAQPLDPQLRERIGIDQNLGGQLPLDLTFLDAEGQSVQLGQLYRGKPVILTLVYYECPMLCTQVLNGMVRSLRPLSFTIGEEFDIITVSIDPDETPELARAKKGEYLKNYGRTDAAAGWHFLTGSQEQITRLAEAVGFRYEYDAATDQFIHASGIVVTTPGGQLSRYFYGIDYPPKDLRLGLVESSDGKIGSPVDQLLLLCYSYDPQSGKYGFVIFTSMRILGIATVLALGIFIFSMLRRDRQRSTASAALL